MLSGLIWHDVPYHRDEFAALVSSTNSIGSAIGMRVRIAVRDVLCLETFALPFTAADIGSFIESLIPFFF